MALLFPVPFHFYFEWVILRQINFCPALQEAILTWQPNGDKLYMIKMWNKKKDALFPHSSLSWAMLVLGQENFCFKSHFSRMLICLSAIKHYVKEICILSVFSAQHRSKHLRLNYCSCGCRYWKAHLMTVLFHRYGLSSSWTIFVFLVIQQIKISWPGGTTLDCEAVPPVSYEVSIFYCYVFLLLLISRKQ